MNDRDDSSQGELGSGGWAGNGLGAFRVRAEFEFAVTRNKIASQKLVVAVPSCRFVYENGFDERIGGDKCAVLGHASYVMFALASDFAGYIGGPTIRTELVGAREAQHLGLSVVKADGADIGRVCGLLCRGFGAGRGAFRRSARP